MKKRIILLVEDEAAIRDMVLYTLGRDDFSIEAVSDVPQAKVYLQANVPDLILLDWMLPGISGIDYAATLKADPKTKHIPLIMLTAKAEEENKVRGLTIGADDYVTKPFSPRELVARINSVLRRGVLLDVGGVIEVRDLHIDTKQHEVTIAGNCVELSKNEYKLLLFFAKHQQHVVTRDQLIDKVWQHGADIDARAVDVLIRRLRKALSPFGYDQYIRTVHGVGYKFSLAEES